MASLADAGRWLKPADPARDLPPLLLMTDALRLADPMPLLERLPRGAGVILRHPNPAARAKLAARLAPTCRAFGLKLLIGNDPRLARRVGAAGVHWAERRLPAAGRRWRRWLPPGALITAAAHDAAAIRRATRYGVRAVLLSPVFATASHPEMPSLGPLRFTRLTRSSPIPVYALGGITATNARRLSGSGAVGLAGIGLFAA